MGPVTAGKSERLLNLLIMLLMTTRPVAKERIREILYPEASVDGFEKMFERDKDELRSLGVPVEVGQIDSFFGDEPGYRVRRDELELPDIELTADEAAVVGLATKVWQHAKLATATTDAVRKLSALGVDVDLAGLDIVEPALGADEPSFDDFWEATQARQAVTFGYRKPEDEAAETRHLQPWGVARSAGRWYVVGFDTDRGAERVFRLSRVVGAARRVGRTGAYDVPPGTDVNEVARRLAPTRREAEVVLLVRKGAGNPLRRDARSVEEAVAGPDTGSVWDRLTLVRSDLGLADEVLTYGADVVVEAPAALREEVVARLSAVVAAVDGSAADGGAA
jgi:proteasome accessory factor B